MNAISIGVLVIYRKNCRSDQISVFNLYLGKTRSPMATLFCKESFWKIAQIVAIDLPCTVQNLRVIRLRHWPYTLMNKQALPLIFKYIFKQILILFLFGYFGYIYILLSSVSLGILIQYKCRHTKQSYLFKYRTYYSSVAYEAKAMSVTFGSDAHTGTLARQCAKGTLSDADKPVWHQRSWHCDSNVLWRWQGPESDVFTSSGTCIGFKWVGLTIRRFKYGGERIIGRFKYGGGRTWKRHILRITGPLWGEIYWWPMGQ